jgi:hypothetical protein
VVVEKKKQDAPFNSLIILAQPYITYSHTVAVSQHRALDAKRQADRQL